MTTQTMTWDRLLNGSAESQASNGGDFKVFAEIKTAPYSCGSVGTLVLIRENRRFYVKHDDYSESFPSKRAALLAYPGFVAALAAKA